MVLFCLKHYFLFLKNMISNYLFNNNQFSLKKGKLSIFNFSKFTYLLQHEIKNIFNFLNKIFYYFFSFSFFLIFFSIITIKLKLFYIHFLLINTFLDLILYIFRLFQIISNITSLFSSVLYIPKLSTFVEKFIDINFFYLSFEQIDLLINNLKKIISWILFFTNVKDKIKKDISTLFYFNLYRVFYIYFLYFYKYYRGFYSFSDIIFLSEEDFIYFIYNYLFFSNKFLNLPRI